MNLVELPPELLAKVIAHYVTKVGVCEAWKRRQTCKTFTSYISVEILARQPIKAFKKSRHSEQLLRRQLSKYLVYRCRSLRGADPVLPQFIGGLAKRFMESIEDDSDTMLYRLTSALSCAIERIYTRNDYVPKLVWNPTPATRAKSIGSDEAKHDVAAAIAIGDKAVFAAIVSRSGNCLFERSAIFGSPLAIAAARGEISMVEVILDVTAHSPPEDHCTRHQFLASGIEAALQQEFYDTALFILRRYRDYLGSAFVLPQFSFDNWMSAAIDSKSKEIISIILRINQNQRKVRFHIVKRFMSDLPGSPLIKEILNTGRERMQPVIKRKWSTELLDLQPSWHRPLFTIHDVRALLDNGADPNGGNGTPHRDGPIWRAASSGRLGMVRLLLDRGADPSPLFNSQGHILFLGRKPKTEQINSLLEKAMQNFKPPPSKT